MHSKKLVIALAVALAAIGALVFWLISGPDDDSSGSADATVSVADEAAEIRAEQAAREAAQSAGALGRLTAFRATQILTGDGSDDASSADEDATTFSPSLDQRFRGPGGDLWSMSSPQVIDLDGDGAKDIVFGTGYERPPADHGQPDGGFVHAISGATGATLWETGLPGEIYSTPRFIDVTDNGTPDVIAGGREGVLVALSGIDGHQLWALSPERIADRERPYNFYTPAVIDDRDGDGIDDLVVTYGGDDQKAPHQERNPSYIALVSGANGDIIKRYQTPDGAETYCSPVVYDGHDNQPWVAFGTGGETHAGTAWRAPLQSLEDGTFAQVVEALVPAGEDKGVMAPIAAVDLLGDGRLALIVRPFDGRTIVVDEPTGDQRWTHEPDGNEESYHGPAIARVDDDATLGLFVSNGQGVFPAYEGTSHYLLDAATGQVRWQHTDDLSPMGAPLAVDLTGDKIDEILFFSGANMFRRAMTRLYFFSPADEHLLERSQRLSILATPVIDDVDERGRLELIVPASHMEAGQEPGPDSVSWRLLRLELDAPPPTSRIWSAYMGTSSRGLLDAAPLH